jgi:hypothetical protein
MSGSASWWARCEARGFQAHCCLPLRVHSQFAGQTIEVRFDPLDLSQVEIYCEGEAQAVARPVDAVVNAQLPSPKPVPAPAPEPTGINFVELLEEKKPPPSAEQEHDKDKDKDKE